MANVKSNASPQTAWIVALLLFAPISLGLFTLGQVTSKEYSDKAELIATMLLYDAISDEDYGTPVENVARAGDIELASVRSEMVTYRVFAGVFASLAIFAGYMAFFRDRDGQPAQSIATRSAQDLSDIKEDQNSGDATPEAPSTD